MIPATKVVAALFDLLKEVPRSNRAATDKIDRVTEAVIAMALVTACEVDGFSHFKSLRPQALSEANSLFSMGFAPLYLMADQEMDYGPVPEGLTGRDLALAVLAIEILEARTPQRLLAERT